VSLHVVPVRRLQHCRAVRCHGKTVPPAARRSRRRRCPTPRPSSLHFPMFPPLSASCHVRVTLCLRRGERSPARVLLVKACAVTARQQIVSERERTRIPAVPARAALEWFSHYTFSVQPGPPPRPGPTLPPLVPPYTLRPGICLPAAGNRKATYNSTRAWSRGTAELPATLAPMRRLAHSTPLIAGERHASGSEKHRQVRSGS
jgi:hypothetical protein